MLRIVSTRHRWSPFAISRYSLSFGSGSTSDYYSLLGVQKDATQRQIKAAYYELSKKYHPDVAGSSSTASNMFLKINEAYECLRDPDRRRSYDNQRYGGGGRYTGDSSDPFQSFYQQGPFQQQRGNPFHNRQFTQAEYERVWREFDRSRNQRETYDQRMEYERQRLWMEFARRRAERWQQFHQKYPNGPPGSIRWEWRFTPPNSQQNVQGWELVRRILLVYFACFFTISLVQVIFQQFGDLTVREKAASARKENIPPVAERDQIEAMMGQRPSPNTSSFMNTPPGVHSQNNVVSQNPMDSLGKEVTYSDGTDSVFSMYVPAEK